MTNNATTTMTTTINPDTMPNTTALLNIVPTVLPVAELEGEHWDTKCHYSYRDADMLDYLCDAVDQEESDSMVEDLQCREENFCYELDAEESDSFDGTSYFKSKSAEGISRFVKENVGATATQLMQGVAWRGGTVSIDMAILLEMFWENDADAGKYEDVEREDFIIAEKQVLALADRYVLQADSTLKLID